MCRVARPGANSISTTPLAPLRNSTFRSIWLAAQISSLGTPIQTVAIGWLMATISNSDLMVALVQASSTLPTFILFILAGAIAGNFNRRRVMLATQCLMALAYAILTTIIALGDMDPWIILGFSVLVGCGAALNNPAWQASVGDIVDRRHLADAVTLLSVGFNIVRSGPALGGVIVTSFGVLTTFALNTLSYLAPLGAIWCCAWKVRSSSLPPESMATAIHDRVRFTAMSSEIKASIARGTLFGWASTSILALLPLIVRDQLMGGPITYGTLMAGFGTGAFFAGISNGLFRQTLSQERLIELACIACAVCSLSLALHPPLILAAAALALGGAGWVVAWSGLGVSVQLASPRWIVGRTLSIYCALTYGGIAAGSWVWGTVAQKCSVSWALAGSAGGLLLVAATGFLLPVGECRESDLDPLEEFDAPALALDLNTRCSPVVVKIEYLIAKRNVQAFLGFMRERRQVQSRVGARVGPSCATFKSPRIGRRHSARQPGRIIFA
ncbi:putative TRANSMEMBRANE TRANSPORT PROTEIN [Bradyrhizobium vignae]|uniref:Putative TRANSMEMBRANE TRANSPORT PROTEIN n=1 Tax=Bradyrhizobium vignae TaxID=1549949 RepID=A0A2U3Q9Q1_9BRAD|nr:putative TRANSMEMBRANE TRANSPORT PROTEIN [Bradyrhizobium vignae]